MGNGLTGAYGLLLQVGGDDLFSCFMDERSVAVEYPASSLAGVARRAIMNSAHSVPIVPTDLERPHLLPG